MRTSLYSAIGAAALILSLGTAIAAPPGVGDPTASKAKPGVNDDLITRAERRITDLHAKLQITAAQQPQWNQFSQIMRDNARNMDQTFQNRVMTMPGMNAAENMASYARVSMQHAQDVQKMLPAFQALYGTMSDAQKKTADQVFRDGANRGGPERLKS